MIVNSPNIQLKISPNLKYIALLHNNNLLLYRERTFLFEKSVKGLDLNLLSVSDKGNTLVQTQNELILIDLNQNEIVLNNKFKEGGILSDFSLLGNKVFFYRRTQDKSFLNILARKEVFLHELGMLNLENYKEEIFFSKKIEGNDKINFKLSPFSNYIILRDSNLIEKINLVSYKVELSYELSDIEVIDYYINNSGDILLYLREKDKAAFYFISNTNKFIIKILEELKDNTVISFNPNKIVLRLKAYPQIFILNKLGEVFLKFMVSDIENLNYPMWAVLFPTYEDIITIYLRQLKLPLDMFYFTYENFKIEVSRWKVSEMKKGRDEDKLASFIQEAVSEREKIVETKAKEIEKLKKIFVEEDNPKNLQKEAKEINVEDKQNIVSKKIEMKEEKLDESENQELRKTVSEEDLMKKALGEIKQETKNIKYDSSKLLKFLEEDYKQEKEEKQEEVQNREQLITGNQETQKYNTNKEDSLTQVNKRVVSEEDLISKTLKEVKEQSGPITYDTSRLLKFLETSEEEEIMNSEMGVKSERVIMEPAENTIKRDLKIDFSKFTENKPKDTQKKVDYSSILDNETVDFKQNNKDERRPQESAKKPQESVRKLVIEEFDKLMENVETKIERTQQQVKIKDEIQEPIIKTETIKSDTGLEIEIKKQITPEEIKKINQEKEELLKQINELNFLKSIGDITEEEYNNKINEIKKRLEEIKKILSLNK